LPISIHSIFLAGALPLHHRDPFDRLIVAQCLRANLAIISHDAQLDAYGVQRIW
jgi:PIN domain nuclease of toxin-antitoxin system